jgi:hypothetical protein
LQAGLELCYGIATGIPRHRTYTQVESYLSDLLSLQDNKIRHQPNAMHDEADGKMQFAALTALRATMHHFIRPEYRDGPFFLHLTDLHKQNIFVDQDWNIQTITDLEWAHTLPSQMQLPPYWLSSRKSVDSLKDQAAISDYETILEEYWAIYEAEERKRNGTVIQVPLQRDTSARGSFGTFTLLGCQRACIRYSIGTFSRYLTESILIGKSLTTSFIGIGDLAHRTW